MGHFGISTQIHCTSATDSGPGKTFSLCMNALGPRRERWDFWVVVIITNDTAERLLRSPPPEGASPALHPHLDWQPLPPVIRAPPWPPAGPSPLPTAPHSAAAVLADTAQASLGLWPRPAPPALCPLLLSLASHPACFVSCPQSAVCLLLTHLLIYHLSPPLERKLPLHVWFCDDVCEQQLRRLTHRKHTPHSRALL